MAKNTPNSSGSELQIDCTGMHDEMNQRSKGLYTNLSDAMSMVEALQRETAAFRESHLTVEAREFALVVESFSATIWKKVDLAWDYMMDEQPEANGAVTEQQRGPLATH